MHLPLPRSRWLKLLLVALLLTGNLLAGRASAEAETGSTLTRLSRKISQISATTPALAAVTPLSGVALEKSERGELESKLVRVLGSAVVGARSRADQPLSEAVARQRALELGLTLVLLRPVLEHGQLTVDVDVIEWELSFWARTRKPRGTVVVHASVSEPADAEIRRYLPRPPGLLAKELRFRAPEQGSIGLACGDTQGGGNSELLIIGRHQLFLGRLSQAGAGGRGSFLARRQIEWSSLSELSPHPLRAPLSGAWLEPGVVLVGSSDRSALVKLDPELSHPLFARPAFPTDLGRCHAFTATGIAAEASSCGPLTAAQPKTTAAALEVSSHDALAVLSHTDERGIVTTYELVSNPGGKVSLTIESPLEERKVHVLPGRGAQVALADLDGDGIVEAITTGPDDGAVDTIEIHSLRAEGPVLVASRKLGPVRALSVCPFEGKNPQRLAVLLDGEIRVFE